VKIDKPGKPAPASAIGKPAASRSGSKSGTTAAGQSSSSNATLGATTAQLGGLLGTPIVDAAKVAEIRQAITEGKFKIDSGVVADRLIKTVRDLINNKSGL
jgi:negative regulator of flagellin synthesis FlgM